VAIEAGVPVIPATEVLGEDMKDREEAEEIGYPADAQGLLGRRRARHAPDQRPDELEEKVREGRREAEAAFGNGEGYLEKMILRARHVEVQILGDSTATSTTSTSATARSSGATRRSWNARPPPI
jgi:pyruvate carboxylase